MLNKVEFEKIALLVQHLHEMDELEENKGKIFLYFCSRVGRKEEKGAR